MTKNGSMISITAPDLGQRTFAIGQLYFQFFQAYIGITCEEETAWGYGFSLSAVCCATSLWLSSGFRRSLVITRTMSESFLISVAYIDLATCHFHLFMLTRFPGSDGLLQQNNTPPHNAHEIKLVPRSFSWFLLTPALTRCKPNPMLHISLNSMQPNTFLDICGMCLLK